MTTTAAPSKPYSVFLSKEEKEELSTHPHALDYSLTKEQLEFLEQHGYVVIKKVIPKETCEETVKEIFSKAKEILKLDVENTYSWGLDTFFLDLWHLDGFYKIRQDYNLYSIFCQLLKTHKLGVSIDRGSLKPPLDIAAFNSYEELKEAQESIERRNRKIELHHDLNLWNTDINKPQYQMGVCLQDCPLGTGGFFCIPGFQKPEVIEEYKKGVLVPPHKNSIFNAFQDDEYSMKHAIEVPLEQGDAVIWNSLLPHSGGFNASTKHWRIHTFLRFVALDGPCVSEAEKRENYKYVKEVVKKSVQTGEKPTQFSTGGRIRGPNKTQEVPFHKAVKFNEIGAYLLGYEDWK